MGTPLGLNLYMVNCPARFEIYDRALALLAKDKVVVDIGAGTGVLSLAAARHGARKVYAVERESRVWPYLQKLIDTSGEAERMQMIKGNFLHMEREDFPQEVDLFVTETISRAWFEEGIHEIARHALKLFPNAQFIPESATLYGRVFSETEIIRNSLSLTLPLLKEIGFHHVYKQSYAEFPAGLGLYPPKLQRCPTTQPSLPDPIVDSW